MRTTFTSKLVLACVLAFGVSAAESQQVPKTDRLGNSVCVIRNDSTNPAVIEYRSNNQWQQLKLEPGKDGNVTGDRVRVATTRDDKAIVTVDLPVQAGKKYRLIWNTQSGMWDFSPAS